MRFERALVVGAGQMAPGSPGAGRIRPHRAPARRGARRGRERAGHDEAEPREARREGSAARPRRGAGARRAGRGLADADLMVEAVVEDAAVEAGDLPRCRPRARARRRPRLQHVLDPIASLAEVTGRPERVIGMHFFNPVPVMTLVEVVRAPGTLDETVREIVELSAELGKTPAEVNDFPGFVSNRVLMPLINEAAYALADGVAEAEAIDVIARLGFNHPMGPLALADLIGPDTCVSIMEVLRDGLGDDKYEPCPLLREHVAAGRLGRKTGAGFYDYR